MIDELSVTPKSGEYLSQLQAPKQRPAEGRPTPKRGEASQQSPGAPRRECWKSKKNEMPELPRSRARTEPRSGKGANDQRCKRHTENKEQVAVSRQEAEKGERKNSHRFLRPARHITTRRLSGESGV